MENFQKDDLLSRYRTIFKLHIPIRASKPKGENHYCDILFLGRKLLALMQNMDLLGFQVPSNYRYDGKCASVYYEEAVKQNILLH